MSGLFTQQIIIELLCVAGTVLESRNTAVSKTGRCQNQKNICQVGKKKFGRCLVRKPMPFAQPPPPGAYVLPES